MTQSRLAFFMPRAPGVFVTSDHVFKLPGAVILNMCQKEKNIYTCPDGLGLKPPETAGFVHISRLRMQITCFGEVKIFRPDNCFPKKLKKANWANLVHILSANVFGRTNFSMFKNFRRTYTKLTKDRDTLSLQKAVLHAFKIQITWGVCVYCLVRTFPSLPKDAFAEAMKVFVCIIKRNVNREPSPACVCSLRLWSYAYMYNCCFYLAIDHMMALRRPRSSNNCPCNLCALMRTLSHASYRWSFIVVQSKWTCCDKFTRNKHSFWSRWALTSAIYNDRAQRSSKVSLVWRLWAINRGKFLQAYCGWRGKCYTAQVLLKTGAQGGRQHHREKKELEEH